MNSRLNHRQLADQVRNGICTGLAEQPGANELLTLYMETEMNSIKRAADRHDQKRVLVVAKTIAHYKSFINGYISANDIKKDSISHLYPAGPSKIDGVTFRFTPSSWQSAERRLHDEMGGLAVILSFNFMPILDAVELVNELKSRDMEIMYMRAV